MDVVTLYNMALGKVGTRTTVSATTEGSNEANSCNTFYAATRDAMLRAAPWNFCRKQLLLTQLKTSQDISNPPPAPWAFEYSYPSDCLKARFILPQVSTDATVNGIPITSAGLSAQPQYVMGPPVKFMVGLDQDGSGNNIRVILTNQFQAQLVYTAAVTDPNLFDPEFIEALTSALGAKVGRNLTADKALVADLRTEAVNFVNAARANNGNEGIEVLNSMPDWMRARGFVPDWQPLGYNDFDSMFQVA